MLMFTLNANKRLTMIHAYYVYNNMHIGLIAYHHINAQVRYKDKKLQCSVRFSFFMHTKAAFNNANVYTEC